MVRVRVRVKVNVTLKFVHQYGAILIIQHAHRECVRLLHFICVCIIGMQKNHKVTLILSKEPQGNSYPVKTRLHGFLKW